MKTKTFQKFFISLMLVFSLNCSKVRIQNIFDTLVIKRVSDSKKMRIKDDAIKLLVKQHNGEYYHRMFFESDELCLVYMKLPYDEFVSEYRVDLIGPGIPFIYFHQKGVISNDEFGGFLQKLLPDKPKVYSGMQAINQYFASVTDLSWNEEFFSLFMENFYLHKFHNIYTEKNTLQYTDFTHELNNSEFMSGSAKAAQIEVPSLTTQQLGVYLHSKIVPLMQTILGTIEESIKSLPDAVSAFEPVKAQINQHISQVSGRLMILTNEKPEKSSPMGQLHAIANRILTGQDFTFWINFIVKKLQLIYQTQLGLPSQLFYGSRALTFGFQDVVPDPSDHITELIVNLPSTVQSKDMFVYTIQDAFAPLIQNLFTGLNIRWQQSEFYNILKVIFQQHITSCHDLVSDFFTNSLSSQTEIKLAYAQDINFGKMEDNFLPYHPYTTVYTDSLIDVVGETFEQYYIKKQEQIKEMTGEGEIMVLMGEIFGTATHEDTHSNFLFETYEDPADKTMLAYSARLLV